MCIDLKDVEQLKLNVDEKMRPKVLRALGVPLPYDSLIDQRSSGQKKWPGSVIGHACRVYRRIRPRRIGDRCFMEPSCSRFVEVCFEDEKFTDAVALSFYRLRSCGHETGGIDLPPSMNIREKR